MEVQRAPLPSGNHERAGATVKGACGGAPRSAAPTLDGSTHPLRPGTYGVRGLPVVEGVGSLGTGHGGRGVARHVRPSSGLRPLRRAVRGRASAGARRGFRSENLPAPTDPPEAVDAGPVEFGEAHTPLAARGAHERTPPK